MELIPGLPDDMATECLAHLPYTEFSRVLKTSKRWKEEINSDFFHLCRKTSGLTQTLFILSQAISPDDSLGKSKYPPAYHLTLYNPTTKSWSSLPPIPDYPNSLPLFSQCTAVGRYLLVIGGWNPITFKPTNAVFIYNFVSSTWIRGADMPGSSRSFFGCATDTYRGLTFVAGGHDDEKNALRSVLVYDVAKDEWAPLPDMANSRDECKAIVHAGKLHVIGGYCTDMQGMFREDSEGFDIATWKWCQVNNESQMFLGKYVVDENGKMFRFYDGNVGMFDGSTWQKVCEVPNDVPIGSFVLMWQGKMLVIGSGEIGGTKSTFMLEVSEEERLNKWMKVEMPKGFSGCVQAGCCLQI